METPNHVVMSQIDEVLTLLLDGQWHNLREIAQTLRMDHRKLHEIVSFLADSDLITKNLSKVQINHDMKKFLESLRELSEREEVTLHKINSSAFL